MGVWEKHAVRSSALKNKYEIVNGNTLQFDYNQICFEVAKCMQWKYTPGAFDSEFTVWTGQKGIKFVPTFFSNILYRQSMWYGKNGYSSNGRNGYCCQNIKTYDVLLTDSKTDGLCVPNIKNTLSIMDIPTSFHISEPWENYLSKNVCFFDVETTGLSHSDYITTAVLYSDKKCFYFVKSVNLHLLPQFLIQFDIVVTYYGRRFDVPVYEKEFETFPIKCHIDLERIYGKMGFRGGTIKRTQLFLPTPSPVGHTFLPSASDNRLLQPFRR